MLQYDHQPKVFAEIVGHDMIIRALCNALQMRRISPMYLFHGPGGTGKTSAARIFGMALNCQAESPSKPCWDCSGCSQSLYIAELCARNRNYYFEKIRTTLTETFSGYKVIIIDVCHSLPVDSWGELLEIEEMGGTVVFIMITENASIVPKAVSSRCQKFGFQKLKDIDIAQKLAQIAAQEGIEIKKEALKLIAKQADGNLREAQNLLDQLALVGQRITTSMVHQFLGLVPNNKLTHLLEVALSGDAVVAVRCTRELIAAGIQPRTLVSQLASLVMETIAGNSASSVAQYFRQMPRSNQLERLRRTLKTLVETEKQLTSSDDQATWVTAALLQIASEDSRAFTSASRMLPENINQAGDNWDTASGPEMTNISQNRHSHLTDGSQTRHHHSASSILESQNADATDLNTSIGLIDMEEVWHSILKRIQNKSTAEFLQCDAKLISLTISRANAIVHLMIKHTLAADKSKELISIALKDALGCPITLNISHEPIQLEFIARNPDADDGKQVLEPSHHGLCTAAVLPAAKTSGSTDRRSIMLRRSASQNSAAMSSSKLASTSRGRDHTVQTRRIQPLPAPVTNSNTCSHKVQSGRDQHQPVDSTYMARAIETKPRLLSITSVPHADASVEPYSQDLLFEEAKIDKQQLARNTFSKPGKNGSSSKAYRLYRSWSCTERFCQNEAGTGKKYDSQK